MVLDREQFLAAVEAYLTRTGAKPTPFGKAAVDDAMFVFKLRDGREPGVDTAARAMRFMEANPEGLPKNEGDKTAEVAAAADAEREVPAAVDSAEGVL